jgi:sRNA-binding protein
MQTVSKTVQNASTLLQTWTRILSQTEHNQRLILNPQWQGASQDLSAIEEEEVYRQQAAERRAAEEQARRDAANRRAEEEQRRAEAAPKAGTRGRGRGTRGRHPLLEAIQASVDKLDVVSIAAGQPVVELAAGSGEGCGDEGGVRHERSRHSANEQRIRHPTIQL